MKIFDDKHIKNVVFVGAHQSGKTTLSETMLFEAGLINRRGSVENKNTVSDYHDVEHERGTSVFATPLHTEWRNYKINIIDTPGLDDFVGEIISSIRVADTILTVINAQNGVEIGTEIIWDYIDRYQKPTVFVVNQIDHLNANFDHSFKSIKNLVGNNAVLVQYPMKIDGAQCIIDVLKMKCYKFGPEGGKPEKLPIPEDQQERANRLHNELVEKAAENDEALMELFFDKGTLNEDEMRMGIKAGMLNHELFPVFCVSALNDMGSGRLMGFIDNVAPAAADLKQEQSVEGKTIERKKEAPTALFVFKTVFQPSLGQITFFKVKSGEVKINDKLVNSRTGETEVLNQLFIMDGKNREPVNKLTVGDIGASLKLKYTETNDTLYDGDSPVTIKPIDYPEPRTRRAVSASKKQEEEKLSEALKKIHSQDPTAVVEYSSELRQMILGCQGELHLATIDWSLKNHYGIEAEFEAPKIAYRETIQRSSSSSYRHKKQSGGAGQFAEVHLKIEPWSEGMPEPVGFNIRGKEEIDLPWGGKLVFYNCIVGGVIDTRFLPSIRKGILEVMESGPLTGSFIRDVRVMVYDGKMHPVDSNDIAFKIAGAHAFKEAFMNANPKLLEPVQEVTVRVPEETVGSVMTDLQSRRSIIQGIDSIDHFQILKCAVPEAELYRYSTDLRSLTQGKATFRAVFSSFKAVPNHIQENLVGSYDK
ncbi:translation elongation factor 2 (EF-2/EF-G) [Muriicola jejuensis]|uniref:Elongation factor G n=1 Tax=Muriicola jejuensis TaxID=504488 RepID=A0A6P0UHJ8_9FLAO|nr:elongation factor G [Muriicola jejuensis]NER11289.1 elongation factor G [Muriicola jejuensis]SMP21773.1 translation elongation factor 2 (EF-2/EF-G) [Muriicola jejuensis]